MSFRRRRDAADFGAEIEAHIELEAERLQQQGPGAHSATSLMRRSGSTNPGGGSFSRR
jgi:hypothetical protein